MQAYQTCYLAGIERKGNDGFSLIELVITIALVSAISATAFGFLYYPVQAYSDVARRAQMVYTSEQALRRMERDIRNSLPNSIRVKTSGNLQAIEFINIVEGFRYRRRGPGGVAAALSFAGADTTFNVFNTFPASMIGNNGYRVVIYNIGAEGASSDDPVAGANAYSQSLSAGPFPPINTHIISNTGTTVTLSNIGNEGRVTLNPGMQFGMESPRQRVFFIDSPVTYVCDPDEGTIVRYQGYNIQQVQPIDSGAIPLSGASASLLANQISSCNFTYQPGTSRRSGTVNIELALASGNEQIRLMQQVSVSNAP